MRLTLSHMLSFEANASPFSTLALDRLPTCSCVHVVELPDVFVRAEARFVRMQPLKEIGQRNSDEIGTCGGRLAANRFGVSIKSAVRWVTRYKTTGNFSPSPSGGDRRSGRIEAQQDCLLGLIRRTPDITLLEIQERLVQNCGERFSVSVLWRFFDRHGITFKKRPRTPRSSGARTFWSSAGTGSPTNSILIPQNSSSSTRPALPPISRESMDAAGADGNCGPPLAIGRAGEYFALRARRRGSRSTSSEGRSTFPTRR